MKKFVIGGSVAAIVAILSILTFSQTNRIADEVYVGLDDVYFGAQPQPLDTTDTLGRWLNRWPAFYSEASNCSSVYKSREIGNKNYIYDSVDIDLSAVYAQCYQYASAKDAYGVRALSVSTANKPNDAFGVYGNGANFSDGGAYGGCFVGASHGTGTHCGVFAESDSLGIWARSTESNGKWAGFFQGDIYITGHLLDSVVRQGKSAAGYFYNLDSTNIILYAVRGVLDQRWFLRDGYGGHFAAAGSTGGPNQIYGVYGTADNKGANGAYGGYFVAGTVGTGIHVGVYGEGDSIGVWGVRKAPGDNFAGYFDGNTYVTDTAKSLHGRVTTHFATAQLQVGGGVIIEEISKVGSHLAVITTTKDTFWLCSDTTGC